LRGKFRGGKHHWFFIRKEMPHVKLDMLDKLGTTSYL
jgi:hypothetical protein